MTGIDTLLDLTYPRILEHWKWLHAHPELSGHEEQTAAYVARQLRELGLDPVEGVGGFGVTALIQGAKPGKCLALRADMDALPITENTGLPFSSTNPGVMHACGHDAHTAMLLGVAEMLVSLRESLTGSVKLIFQPSEETADNSGAKRMIADGALEHPHVDAIIGQHDNANREIGTVTVRPGPVSAASDRFFITIEGKSCHAARPDDGVDAIVVGAQVITALQTIVSRSVSPLDSCVVTIGKVSGGTRYNVVADSFEIEGTCRTLNPAVRDRMPETMERIVKGIAESAGAGYSFRYVKGYSPVINHPDMCRLIRDTVIELTGSEDAVLTGLPSLGGEDFSFYAEQVPAAFYRVGCATPGAPFWPQHNEHFVPNEQALKQGAQVMLAATLRFLGRN